MNVPPPPRPDLPPSAGWAAPPPDSVGRDAPSPPATWSALEAIPVFFLALVVGGLVALVLTGVLRSSCAAEFVVLAGSNVVGFAATVILWVRFVNRGSLRALGLTHRPLRDVGVGALGGLGLVLVVLVSGLLATLLVELLLGQPPVEPEQVPSCVAGTSLALTGVIVILGAPIGEELFFRGFLYKALRRRLRTWVSVLISSTIFGLVHFSPPVSAGLVLVLALFPIGVGLALIYEHRHSLVASITAHAVFNVFGFVLIAFGPD